MDFIALSFVRSADDIRELKTLLGDKVDKIKIIAKIEDQEGVKNLDAIIQEAAGVMVARGGFGCGKFPLKNCPLCSGKLFPSARNTAAA